MASIHEFAPTPSDSDLNKTNFSTNYGFNVVSNNPIHQGYNGLQNGLYYYANAHKDPQALAEAQTYFGSQLLDRKYADYWVGEALVTQGGFKNITDAYIAFDIPIPDNVSDPRQLSATLGRNVLEKHSKEYDKRAEAIRVQSARVSSNFQNLLAGNLKPEDLDPKDLKEIQDVYGYSPHDIYAAGMIVRADENRSTWDLVTAPASWLASSVPLYIQRTGEFAGKLFKGDLKGAVRAVEKGGSRAYNEWHDDAAQTTAGAYANQMVQDARFLELATNPQKALEIAASEIYRRDKETLENATMVGRLVRKADDALYDVYQGTTDLPVTAYQAAAKAIDIDTSTNPRWQSSPAPDVRWGQMASATVKGAEMQARADVQDSRGVAGWVEQGADFLIDTAALANPYTALGSTASLFRDNAGQNLSKITSEDGIIDPNVSSWDIYGKASGSAAITYLTRSIGARFMPRIMNKGLGKLGVNSTWGNALGSATWSTVNFATIVPAMDAGLRAVWDATLVTDPRLKDGWDSLQQLQKDLGTPKHWVVSAVPGIGFSFPGSRAYARQTRALKEMACSRGLSPAEAESITRNTPLEKLPEALFKATEAKHKDNPQEALNNAISYTRGLIEQEKQRAVEENGKQVKLDAAKQATLRLYGISISQGPDASKTSIHMGGKVDPETGKYVEGTTIVELPTADAEFYLGSIFNRDASDRAEAIRNTFANGKMLEAAQKMYGDKIRIDAISSPFNFSEVISQGKQAESLIKSRTKEIMDSSKGEDGKPSISEADARAKASKEVHPDLHKEYTLETLVHYGKEAQRRLDNETKRNQSIDPDTSFMSRAYVISKGSRDDGSYTRILKIAEGASTREIAEEYAEMWLQDYIFNERMDYADVWRQLYDLSKNIGKGHDSLVSLQNTNPKLAEQLNNDLKDSDIVDPSILDDVKTDVIEAFSRLLMANLRQLAIDGKMPDFAVPLLDAKFATDLAMQQEMALAATINAAKDVGKQYETINRLLGLQTEQVENILKSIEPPTVDAYTEAYIKSANTYAALAEGETRTADEVESILAEQAQQEHILQEEIRQQEEQRAEPFVEAVKEAESLPENKGKSHEQIVQEVNEKAIEAQEETNAESPLAVKDPSSTNGSAIVTYDDGNIACHQTTVNIADLKMMPNFKSGSDKDTGEVHPLTGDYHPDHDPIRIFRQYDGTLLVISGRHRLAHAKRHGAKKIVAYIYDESPEHNLAWAQMKDIEWNIKDNQATPLDVALLIRGELIDGIPPLSDADIARMGITRKGSLANRGYEIGKNATSQLIEAWRNDTNTFTDNVVSTIALFAPNNPLVQQEGIRAAQDGIAAKNLPTVMGIKQDRINYLTSQGIAVQLNLFGEGELDSTYDNFVTQYVTKKVNFLNNQIKALSTANKIAKDKDFAALTAESGLRVDNALRSRNKKLKNKPLTPQELLHIWQHPWTNMDTIGKEIDDAFAKEHPEEWAKMQERKREMEAQQQALAAEPAPEDAPDLGNAVQGDTSNIPTFNFSVIGKNAKTWDKYVDKAFKGRDDGLMRAEIDDSKSRMKILTKAESTKHSDYFKNLSEDKKDLLKEYNEAQQTIYNIEYLKRRIKENEEDNKPRKVQEYKEELAKYKDISFYQELRDKLQPEVFSIVDDFIDSANIREHYDSLNASGKKYFKEDIIENWFKEQQDREFPKDFVIMALAYDGKSFKLSDVLDHPELFEAYPQLKDINISFKKMYPLIKGGYAGNDIMFNLYGGNSPAEYHSTLLHEIQHAIQAIEGFSTGGNSNKAERFIHGWEVPNMKKSIENDIAILLETIALIDKIEAQKPLLEQILSVAEHVKAHPLSIFKRIDLAKLINKYNKEVSVSDVFVENSQVKELASEIANVANVFVDKKNQKAPYIVKTTKEILSLIEKGLSNQFAQEKQKALNTLDYFYKQHEEVISLNELRQNLQKLDLHYVYERFGGEIESRNVQYRKDWTEEQRQATPFNSTLEYPGEAIVIPQTFSFSVTSEANLQRWQIDKSYGLGTLGHFTDPLNYKLQDTGIDIIDTRLKSMRDHIRRRYNELRHVHGEERATLIAAEMSAIFNGLILPQGYRFGLEPYHEFANIYANLRAKGDPDLAPQSLPMRAWPEIMAKSFRSQFESLLNGRLSEAEEIAFFNKYNDFAVDFDLADVKQDLNRTRRAYFKQVREAFPKDAQKTPEYKKAMAEAREQAYQDVADRHREMFETAYKALATIRAERLVQKFIDRVLLRLDNYRKDRILKIINRALASITPTKTKDGKPVKGTVPMDVYRTVLDNYRLLRLTKAQKENFEDSNPDLANLADDAIIHVETYNENGEPITLKVTKSQYETYASLEAMTGDQAEAASRALGTLIADGKEAWKQQAEMEKAQVEAFCSPIYKNYSENQDKYAQRLRVTQRDTLSKEEANAIKGMVVSLTNDGQLIDFISSIKGLEQFKAVHSAIAQAHSYIEKAEAETEANMFRAAAEACGFTNVNPYNPTEEQHRKISEFSAEINDIKDVNLTFTPQAPDFTAQQTALHRTALLRRLSSVTRKKNYNPHELAVALQAVRQYMPARLYQEAMDLYGNIGDPSKYKGELATALNNVFSPVKFGYLRNINDAIKTKAEAQLDKWSKENTTKPYTITKLTRNEAAYRVLMFEQADYTDLMRRQGYTDAMISELEKFAGADMMKYAYALRDLMNARMPQIKAIYEATYGTPFPVVENYFRAFFDAKTQQQTDSSLEGQATGVEGKDGGSIKLFYTRIKHNAQIMPTMTVTHAFMLGMKQQANLIAYADPTTHRHIGEFMRKVLANRQDGQELRKVLDTAIGKPFAAALQTQVDHMYRIYGHAEAYASTANRIIRNIGAGASFGLLAWNIASLAKNSLAYFNTLGGSSLINPLQWAKSMARVTLGQGIKKGTDLAKEDFIKSRFKGIGTESYLAPLLQMAGVKEPNNRLTRFANTGLALFGKYDRYMTSKSAAVLYDAVYRHYQKTDPSLTPDALDALALDEVKRALTVKGQPLDWRSRPLQSSRNSWMTAASFFLGGEAFNTFGDIIRLGMRTEWSQLLSTKNPERRKQAWRNLANFAAVWMVNGFVYSLMGLGFAALLDDEEQWRKRNIGTSLLWGTLLGPITGMPVISGLANSGVRALGVNFYMPSSSYLPMADFSKTAKELNAIWKEDASGLDRATSATYAARDIAALFLMTTQRPSTTAGAAIKTGAMATTAIANILNFILRGARATEERFTK